MENKFFVGVAGEGVAVIMRPPLRMEPILKADVINLCAWLICLSGATRDEFEAALSAVEAT